MGHPSEHLENVARKAILLGQQTDRRSRTARRPGFTVVAALLVAMWGLPAEAREPPAAAVVVERLPERSAIDWTRGLITAVGAASGDLRAPSPAVARVAARRRARERGIERLRAYARMLEVGGTGVAALADADAGVARRLERALERALELDVAYASDGSVILSVGLPLEAIRLALAGGPAAVPGGAGEQASGPRSAGVIVDARGILEAPALGLELQAGDLRYAGPTVFYRQLEAASADPRLGEDPVRLRARGHAAGRLVELAESERDIVRAALQAGALVVIVIGKGT